MTVPDHLAVWQRARHQVAWREIVPFLTTPVSAVRDGFTCYAHATAGRGTHRLSRLLLAYQDVRREAISGTHLTPDLTARWSRIIRGIPAATFRRTTAYAKNGRERYGLHADTEQQFARCLAEAADPEIPVTARAARAYLDIAFFHPYDDGNARLAGLALAFVLLSGNIELDEVEPILTIVRRADDVAGAANLVRLIHGIAAATHRRSTCS